MMCWNGEKFLTALEKHCPLCVADLSRNSMMENSAFYKVWQEGMETEGSSTAFLYMDELGVNLKNSSIRIRLGAGHDRTVANMLKARVGKGRDLLIQSRDNAVLFQLGNQAGMSAENSTVTLTLPANILEELCSILQQHTGIYSLTTFPMTVEVVPTKIKDSNGNVTKVIE